MLGALALARGVAATTTTATTSSVDDADDTSLIGYYVGESTGMCSFSGVPQDEMITELGP